ncbi:MAG TPA: hypothetical protein VG245_07940 [Candidatus Dormibacteraeota bacterium]|nr:hypothetical protein [Candidatus Dormibacteraeota bacterium]
MELDTDAAGASSATGPLAAAEAFLARPAMADEGRLRLGVTVVLAAAGLAFFRLAALPVLAGALVGALALLTGLYVGFHTLGRRSFGRVWPGASRGLGTGLLVFCLCPPGTPPWLAALLSAVAGLIEGRLRRVALPLALNGALVVWPLAWAWQAHADLGFVRPFDLRPLEEPIKLWTQAQIALDPVRLYTGNVPGLLGATSFGLVALGVLVLAYARRASWAYLAAAAAPVLLGVAVARQPLTVYLVSGPALAFAGLIGADARRLPKAVAWRVGGGVAAGLIALALLRAGAGLSAYGAGVLTAGAGVALFQLFGLAGAPAVVRTAPAGAHVPSVRGLPGLAQAAALVVFLPLGLLLIWRDPSLSRSAKASLTSVGLGLYVFAGAAAVAWVNLIRLPA